MKIIKNQTNNRDPSDNKENYEKLRNTYENHENQ